MEGGGVNNKNLIEFLFQHLLNLVLGKVNKFEGPSPPWEIGLILWAGLQTCKTCKPANLVNLIAGLMIGSILISQSHPIQEPFISLVEVMAGIVSFLRPIPGTNHILSSPQSQARPPFSRTYQELKTHTQNKHLEI